LLQKASHSEDSSVIKTNELANLRKEFNAKQKGCFLLDSQYTPKVDIEMNDVYEKLQFDNPDG